MAFIRTLCKEAQIENTRNDGRYGAGGVCVRVVIREREWDLHVEVRRS